MINATYEKRLLKAYNQTELYKILPAVLAMMLVNTYQTWKRGLTVKQVIAVLDSQLIKPYWDYNTIQLALNETEPKGKRHDANY